MTVVHLHPVVLDDQQIAVSRRIPPRVGDPAPHDVAHRRAYRAPEVHSAVKSGSPPVPGRVPVDRRDATWDRLARSQSLAETASTELFDTFLDSKWNYFRFDDPADTPSSLFDQLTWLKAAGFEAVDCFWLQAGHAIWGGYKEDAPPGGVPFEVALRSAERALGRIDP